MNYNHAIQKLDIPARFLKLPIDERGYPVPKFVKYVDGKPDFRVVATDFFRRAMAQKLCWLCGETLGRYMAFVRGPMCAIKRINSEPPSHLDCARFAVKACPFLTQPRRGRDKNDMPENFILPGGVMLERNPGVSLIWVCESYKHFKTGDGILFEVGDARALEWYARGRKATRDEIMASIEGGLPILRDMAEKEGPDAVAQ